MIDIKTATTAELVNFYNAHSGKSPIKKFADRKTAERRVGEIAPSFPSSSKKTTERKVNANAKHVQHKVTVNGVEYRSVKAAFEALKLPLGRHIAFRAKLKAAGKLDFDDKHKFAIVVS